MKALTIQAQIIIAVGIAIVAFLAGFKLQGVIKDNEIAEMKTAYDAKVLKATNAKLAAVNHARDVEQLNATAMSAAATTFEEKRKNEKATDDRTIADLRSRVTSLRVSTRNPGSRDVPGAPAGACAGDGQAEQTLAPAVAARLAQRYADYNAVIDQLELCQATLIIDRQK